MKKSVLSFVAVLFLLPLFCQTTEKVSEFTGFSVSGNIVAKLVPTAGDAKVVYTIIKGDAEDFDILVVDKSLRLKINNNWGRSKTKVEATVYYNKLNKISTSAGSALSNDGELKTQYLSLSASSGSDLNLAINTSEVNVSASSGTSVSLSGKGGLGNMSASSGSSISAKNLVISELTASSSSGASISTHVTDSITASASSGGSVSYKGEPKKVNKSKSSSGGSISKI
jgi:Putative auto-transporter adhesin, head GIN domain